MEKIKIFTSSTRICPGMTGSLLSWEHKANWVPALLTGVMAISIPLSVLYDFLVYRECTLPVVLPRYKIQETGYQRIDKWKIISRKLSTVNCSYTAGYLVYCTNSTVCDTYPPPVASSQSCLVQNRSCQTIWSQLQRWQTSFLPLPAVSDCIQRVVPSSLSRIWTWDINLQNI